MSAASRSTSPRSRWSPGDRHPAPSATLSACPTPVTRLDLLTALALTAPAPAPGYGDESSPARLVRRLIAYQALDEFMPIFAIYALLFADNGLSTAEISSLLVLWSVVTFVLEVPSGAWADIVSRRLLLCFSSIAYGAAFATWLLVPSYLGFAVGFAL